MTPDTVIPLIYTAVSVIINIITFLLLLIALDSYLPTTKYKDKAGPIILGFGFIMFTYLIVIALPVLTYGIQYLKTTGV